MPEGYLPKLVEMTGKDRTNISTIVRDERIGSKIWPYVEKLAKETDSKAYNARMEFLATRRNPLSGAAA